MSLSSIRNLFAIAAVVMAISCTSRPHDVVVADQLPKIYPDYIGVTIPANIAPLNFCMAGEDYQTMDVTVKGEKEGEINVNGDYADFPIDEWHNLLRKNQGSKIMLTVCVERDNRWTEYKEFTINVDSTTLEEWGVTYRLIDPSYEVYGDMGIYQRALADFHEEQIMKNTQSVGMCLNCHTQNASDPSYSTFHVRGEHGATFIRHDGKEEWLKAKNDVLGSSIVYPFWHPSGKYCAYSTNDTHQMFHSRPEKRIEVFDLKSDIVVYCPSTKEFIRDPRLMTEGFAENCPAFSADGKTLYYITAPLQSYPEGYDKMKYSICSVAFDPTNGTFGEKVDTLFHAEKEGMSATWPRPSRDGRFLMFTLLDYGYFSIWHPEADLCLLDLSTGSWKTMQAVNSYDTESFHNWARSGGWFLFTSRRDDGLHTRLYFARVNPDGSSTKPFMLPQRNPYADNFGLLQSYNTPDFTNRKVDFDAVNAGKRIDSDIRE